LFERAFEFDMTSVRRISYLSSTDQRSLGHFIMSTYLSEFNANSLHMMAKFIPDESVPANIKSLH
jgi:hypothetical protein